MAPAPIFKIHRTINLALKIRQDANLEVAVKMAPAGAKATVKYVFTEKVIILFSEKHYLTKSPS